MRRILIVAFVLGSCLNRAQLVAALSCEDPHVPAGTTATLGADMDCGLVYMGYDSTIDLNGYTFTGLILGPEGGGPSRHTIRGPGEIHAQYAENPCVMFYSGSVVIDGGDGQVTLTQCGYGVLANVSGSRLTLRNVTMRRTYAVPMILGVQAGKVSLENVTIDHRETLDINRGDGIIARKITGSGVTLNHLAKGLAASVVKVSDVLADDVTMGVVGTRRADLIGFTSTRHWIGAYSKKLSLTSSSVTDANPQGIDIAASRRPILVDTTCELSGTYDPFSPGLVFGPPWGVCSLD